ncbi:MAG: hypothetical protein AAF984_07630 [Verrucomicrobiota bacterium]
MKSYLATIKSFLFLSLLCFVVTPTFASDDKINVSSDRNLTENHEIATSDILLRELYKRFITAGAEAYYIVYDWRNMHGKIGRHTIVVYKDAEGRYFGMDQTLQKPKWIQGKNATQWVQSFSNHEDTFLVQVNINEESKEVILTSFPEQKKDHSIQKS